ncbi:MAG TPA: autotransporter-associated beta strand repeat-containing protein [Gemmataceae bacterium]|nr:autotransporter-associated beta strand repeat-containing protein [Gemmataceae bacterium]
MFSLFRKPRKSQPARRRRTGSFLPALEGLEARLTPSTTNYDVFTWTGADGNGLWSDAKNWSSGSGKTPATYAGTFDILFDYGKVKTVNDVLQTTSTDDISGTLKFDCLWFKGNSSNANGSRFIIEGSNPLDPCGPNNNIIDDASGGSIDQVMAPLALSANMTINNDHAINSNGDYLTLSGQRTVSGGSFGLVSTGAGWLTLEGTSASSVGLTADAGVVNFYGKASVQQAGSVVVNSGATVYDEANPHLVGASLTVNTGGTFWLNTDDTVSTLSGAGTVQMPSVLTIAGPGSGTFSGTLSGGGDLTVTGGTETLSGNSGYGGATAVTGGELILATLKGINSSSGITVSAGGTLGLKTANALKLVANFTTPLTLNGGGANGAGALDNISGSNKWTGPITLASDSTIAGQGSLSLSGAIGGPGGLTSVGSGAILIGSNTYTGPTVVSAGTLILASANAVKSSSGVTVDGGATLALNNPNTAVNLSYAAVPLTLNGSGAGGAGALTSAGGSVTWTGPITLASNSTISAGVTLEVTGAVGGSGGLTVEGSASDVLVLDAADTYTGATVVASGTLDLWNAAAVGSSSGTTVDSGATLAVGTNAGLAFASEPLTLNGSGVNKAGALDNVTGNNSWAGPITLASNSTINVGGTLTLGGAIGGAGGLTEIGSGTLIFQGPGNSYAGTTTVDSGTLELDNSNLAVGNGYPEVPGPLVIGDGAGKADSAVVQDLANYQMNGTGEAVTLKSDGELYLAPGVSDLIVSLAGSGGLVDLDTSGTSSAFLGVYGGTGTTEYDGGFGGGGLVAFTATGSTTTTLGGASPNFTGTIEAGYGVTLAVKNSGAVGKGEVDMGGGTLELENGVSVSGARALHLDPSSVLKGVGGNTTWASPVVLVGLPTTSTAAISAAANTTLTISGVISQSAFIPYANLAMTGAGKVDLTAKETYTGTTFVNGGTLSLGGSAVIGAVTVASGATLSGTGTAGAVTVDAHGTLRPGSTSSPGVLTTGAVTFAQGSTYSVSLGTQNASSYVKAFGPVSLTGAALTVNLTQGYHPPTDQEFTILEGESITGNFASEPTNYDARNGGSSVVMEYVGGSRQT